MWFVMLTCRFLHIQPRLDLLRTRFKFPGSAGRCRLWNSILLFHTLPLIWLFTLCSYCHIVFGSGLFCFFKENLSHRWNAHEFSCFLLFHALCKFVNEGRATDTFLMLQDAIFFCLFFFNFNFFQWAFITTDIWESSEPGNYLVC